MAQHKFRTTMRTPQSSAKNAKIAERQAQRPPSPAPSQASLSAARRALLMTETSDPRSPWIYERVHRRTGQLHYSQQPSLELPVPDQRLPYPHLDRGSLRTLRREEQRSRVADPERPTKPSKPWKLWRSKVRLGVEQRLAEEEAEELVEELNEAMGRGDLEEIGLLTRQIDEVSNGVGRERRKGDNNNRRAGVVTEGGTVWDFARRLRIEEEEEDDR